MLELSFQRQHALSEVIFQISNSVTTLEKLTEPILENTPIIHGCCSLEDVQILYQFKKHTN